MSLLRAPSSAQGLLEKRRRGRRLEPIYQQTLSAPGLGVQYARKRITIRFEPATCEMAFYYQQEFIRRRPALGLSLKELTCLGSPKDSPRPQQLLLPLPDFLARKG